MLQSGINVRIPSVGANDNYQFWRYTLVFLFYKVPKPINTTVLGCFVMPEVYKII